MTLDVEGIRLEVRMASSPWVHQPGSVTLGETHFDDIPSHVSVEVMHDAVDRVLSEHLGIGNGRSVSVTYTSITQGGSGGFLVVVIETLTNLLENVTLDTLTALIVKAIHDEMKRTDDD